MWAGSERRGLVFWQVCDVLPPPLSLSLSLMLKWLEKESEVLCEAVIRLNYKGFGALLLLSLCSVPFSLLPDDVKWDQVGAEMDRHKDTQRGIAFQSEAANAGVSVVMGISGARVYKTIIALICNFLRS